MKTTTLLTIIINYKTRSAWEHGVKSYAAEILNSYLENGNDEFYGSPADKKALLNGASSWNESSWGGCYEIYNSREEWLDVQARALYQAERLIIKLAKA